MRRTIVFAALILFTVAFASPALATLGHGGTYLSLPSATINGDSVVISWAGTPGNQQDWITVVKAGTSEKEWGQWTYTAGKKAGNYTAKGLTSGEYEARLYYDYPKGGFTVIERVKFTVVAGAPKGKYMSLTAAQFAAGSAVMVTWFNTPGNAQDWITVAKAGTPAKEWGKWTYLKSKKMGTYEVKGLAAGNYEARLYFDYPKGGFTIQETLKFSVK
jgi:hypothetical protein